MGPTRLFEDHLPSVAYLLHVNINETSSCTVSIINSEWLITSSGCVSNIHLDPAEWVAFAGHAQQTLTPQIRQVKRIITKSSNTEDVVAPHEVALIQLSEPFE